MTMKRLTVSTFIFAWLTVLLWWPQMTCASLSSRISVASGWISRRVEEASEAAQMEQDVEDVNAVAIAAAKTPIERLVQRRLVCLPLDERFDPPPGVFSHGHVQTGDKMSLPSNFFQAIQLSGAEVPYLFQVERVDKGDSMDETTRVDEGLAYTKERVTHETDREDEFTSAEPLDKVVGGPIDFRAPSNYCFLPWWMMRALGLQPRDVVHVSLIQTVPAGSQVQLRPHSSKFAKDIAKPQAVLETELKHYSSLTKGSTIAFDYNKERYWFDVVGLRSAPRGEKVPMVKMQDCDVATDFLKAKDVLKKKKRKEQEQNEEF